MADTACHGFDDGTVPDCLFGDCISDECKCWEGVVHDKIVGRYNNCGMFVTAQYVLAGVSVAINLCPLVFGLYVAKRGCEPHTDAQKLAYVVSLTGLSFLSANIVLLAMDFIMPVWGAMFVNVGMASVALSCGIVVHSAAKPVAVFMHFNHIDKLETLITKVIPGILLAAGTMCTIVGHAIGTNQSISSAIAACYFVILFCAACYLPTFFFLSKLLAGLNQAIDNTQHRIEQETSMKHIREMTVSQRISQAATNFRVSIRGVVSKAPYATMKEGGSPGTESSEVLEQRMAEKKREQNQKRIRRFRAKVIFIRFTCALACLGLVLFSVAAGVLDFGFGTLPFSGFLFFALSICIGGFSLQLAHYAWTANPNRKGDVSDDEHSHERKGNDRTRKAKSVSSITQIGTDSRGIGDGRGSLLTGEGIGEGKGSVLAVDTKFSDLKLDPPNGESNGAHVQPENEGNGRQ